MGTGGSGASGVIMFSIVMTAQMTQMPLPAVGKIVFQLLGGVTAFTVLTSIGTPLRSITRTLSSAEISGLAKASSAGLRTKTLWDEDDGGTRWEAFSVTP